ncbi:MAG: polyprenyl synthetase family protein [Elusimicrobia bacterium]|nr:polyprenyl synthetase family protein [Elusimicrobiota bacterium]
MDKFLIAVKNDINSSLKDIPEKYFDFKKNFIDPLGKATRTRFAYHIADALAIDTDKIIKIASSAELIHLASLLHDDCVDDGVKRRGNPTINFTFGLNMAILVGDFTAAIAFRKANSISSDISFSLADCVEDMSKGALLEENSRYKIISSDIYSEVISLKTTPLFKWIATSCGLISGGSFSRELERISDSFGMSFQIIDDILDISGDENSIGKDTFKDILEGKINYPVLLSLDDDYVRKRIEGFFNDRADLTSLYELKKYIIENGYIEKARDRALKLIEEVETDVHKLPNKKAAVELYNFMYSMTEREK